MSINSAAESGFTHPDTFTTMSENKEKARKKIVVYVFAIYWLLIFEGALRKWVFPEFHQIIFFLRDPIALLAYYTAWRYKIFSKSLILTTGVVLSLAFLPLIFYQVVVVKMHPLTLVYGWRMYFYYLPLAFVIKDSFGQEDIFKLISQTLYVAIPLSGLVFYQYISPPSHFINAAYGAGKAFVVTGNIVRTTGTFTFTAGQTFFASSLMAFLVIAWIYRKRFAVIPFHWLIIATLASISTLLLSGSRTAFFMTGLIVIAAFIGLVFTNETKLKLTGLAMIVVLVLLTVVLFMGPFKKSLEALGTRFEQAERSEGSAFRRALAPLVIFTRHIATSPTLGYGVGYGTGGGSKLATGKATLVLAEDEWSRIIMEAGPALGLLYILYRAGFTVFLGLQCIASARTNNNLIPAVFFGFIGFYIFAGQITHTGTIQGYNWIFVGLIMAAAKKQNEQQEDTKAPSIPLFPNIVQIS